jgi:hypothetical protein
MNALRIYPYEKLIEKGLSFQDIGDQLFRLADAAFQSGPLAENSSISP